MCLYGNNSRVSNLLELATPDLATAKTVLHNGILRAKLYPLMTVPASCCTSNYMVMLLRTGRLLQQLVSGLVRA